MADGMKVASVSLGIGLDSRPLEQQAESMQKSMEKTFGDVGRAIEHELSSAMNNKMGALSEGVARELRMGFEPAMRDLREKIQAIGSDMTGFERASGSMERVFQKSFRVMSVVPEELNKRLHAVSKELSKTGNVSAGSMSIMENSLQEANTVASYMETALGKLTAQMRELRNSRIDTPEYEELSAALANANRQISQLVQRQEQLRQEGVDEGSVRWKRLSAQLVEAKADAEGLREAIRQMETEGTAFVLGKDTSRFEFLRQMSQDVFASFHDLTGAISDTSAEYDRLKGSVSETTPELREQEKAVSETAKAGRSAAGGLGGARRRIRDIGTEASAANLGLNRMVRSIRNLGIVSFGMRTVSALFGRFRSVVSSSVSSNAAMSETVERLKNGLSNALAPAINVVINGLSRLMPYVVGVSDAMASLFTNLFGVGWTNVSTGADAAAASIGGATKAQEEYNRTIAGFDEITKIDAESGFGGGGGTAASADAEGIVGKLPSWLTGLSELLTKAIQAGDWKALGIELGRRVNSLIDEIPWADAGAKVGTAINGLFSTTYWTLDEVNFENLGARIAEFVNNAIGNIDFDIAGRLPVKGLTSIINTIVGFLGGLDWGQIGTAVSEFFSGALAEATGWLQSKDWEQIGQNLMTSVEEFLNGFDKDELSGEISDFVSTLFLSVSDFLAGIDIGALISEVNAFINDLISRLDWAQIGLGIATFFLEVIKEIPGIIVSSFQAPLDLLDKLFGGDTFLGKAAEWLGGISSWFNSIKAEDMVKPLLLIEPKLRDWWAGIKQTCVDALNGIIMTLNNMITNVTGALADTRFGQWLASRLGIGSLDEIHIPLIADVDPPPGWYTDEFLARWESTFGEKPLGIDAEANISTYQDSIPKRQKRTSGIRDFTVYPERMALDYLSDEDRTIDTVAKYTDASDVIPQSKRIIPAEANIISKRLAPTFEKPSIKSVAELVSSTDNIRNKNLYGFDAGLQSRTDAISNKELFGFSAKLATAIDNIRNKSLNGFDAGLQSHTDAIGNKKLLGFNAELTNRTDSIKNKILSAFTAVFEKPEDKIKNRNMEGFIAAFTKSENALPAIERTVNTTAKFTATDSSAVAGSSINSRAYFNVFSQAYTPEIKATAKITSATVQSGVVVKGGMTLQTKASGGVFSAGVWRSIPQYAGGTANAHGSLFVAGEAGPEVVGHIGGRTEVLNRSQLATTMSYAVAAGMSTGMRSLAANAIPRLAIVGQTVSREEEHLSQLAQYAASESNAGGTARVIELLVRILEAILDIDPDVKLDGASIKSRIVTLINQNTRATGVCEIIV